MPEDMKADIEERMLELQGEFETLSQEFRHNAKRNSEIQARQIELRGAYQELEALSPKTEEEAPVVEESATEEEAPLEDK